MDSASKRGAIFLREGKWDGSNLTSQEWSWCLADKTKYLNRWIYEHQIQKEQLRSGSTTRAAMKACLEQMVSDKSGAQVPILILFRFFKDGASQFRGLMSWKLSGNDKKEEFKDTGKPFEYDQADDEVARGLKGLHLTWNIKAPEGYVVKKDPTRRFFIQWGVPGASEQTEKECLDKLQEYFDNCCIARGALDVQWESIKKEHDKFWNTACELWKHPMVTHTPKDRSKEKS